MSHSQTATLAWIVARSSSQPTGAVLKKVSPELLTVIDLGIRLREYGLGPVDERLRHNDRSCARRCDDRCFGRSDLANSANESDGYSKSNHRLPT